MRRNRIFLLMEEARRERARAVAGRALTPCACRQIRRLRIQQRLKTGAVTEDDVSKQEFNSALPLLPPLVRLAARTGGPSPHAPVRSPRLATQSETSIQDYYIAFTVLVLALIAFGGYVAPMAELKLGLGCAVVSRT